MSKETINLIMFAAAVEIWRKVFFTEIRNRFKIRRLETSKLKDATTQKTQ